MRLRLLSVVVLCAVTALVPFELRPVPASSLGNVRPSVVVPTTWNQLLSPGVAPPTYQAAYLQVSCAGSAFCVAVGNASNSTGAVQIAAQWDGTQWRSITGELPAVPPGPTLTSLGGVSCVSTSWCMIVGDTDPDGVHYQDLAYLWNGTTRQPLAIPNPAPGSNGEYRSLSTAPVLRSAWLP
jgi:hypothetical protein